jgi:hypothetical protein
MYHKEDKDSLIVSVSESLKEIYDEYSSCGMLAIYIWGSILTPDFNPESSDIDTIAIVDNGIDSSSEEKIQKQLASKHPEIKKLGFRLLYKSEFNTGISKGALGSIGNPALLLLDFPTWRWVCGTEFTQKDFDLPVPTYFQAIKLRYENTDERWPDIDAIKPEDVQYFIKQILRIVHLKQLQRINSPYTMFSYSSVREVADGTLDAELVNICLAIKAAKWDFELFKNNIHIFKQYISDLKLEIGK